VSHTARLGQVVSLAIRRFGPPGAFLVEVDASQDAETVLLPGAEIPDGAEEGNVLSVFLYLDSEDRPVATVREPKIVLGEVAFLTVTALAPFGAFVDWGLPKELLVPFGEQTRELRVGDRHPIGVYVDDTGRLAGTMRVSEMLQEPGRFKEDEWVAGEAWRNDPDRGVFVIVEQRFVGLLPVAEPHGLSRGDAGKFRVSNVLPDGKIELSLRGPAHEELAKDAAHVLAILERADTPRVGDRSDPQQIRDVFGLSKKAFKRAAGRLLRLGDATVDRGGFLQPRRTR
jgi:predicted RNA-binding protein (virulence factor B family)